MSVMDPGSFKVICDGCNAEEDMNTAEHCGNLPTWAVDDSTLESNGRHREGDLTYCGDCAAEDSLIEKEGEET